MPTKEFELSFVQKLLVLDTLEEGINVCLI
jgi:hypothetical protein